MNLTDWLQSSGACNEGLQWARGLSPQEAWEQCNRPDWMLWALEELGYADQRVSREFACWCVRQVWELLTDPRSRTAVEVAERYARGEATATELSAAMAAARDAAMAAARDAAMAAARDAAWDAAMAAAWDAAWDAARAAAWAAAEGAARSAARAAAEGAARAAACYAARDAAWPVVRAAAWPAARAAQANMLREVVPWSVVDELLSGVMEGMSNNG